MAFKMFKSNNTNPPPNPMKIIAIAAGKGGVGKSSVTVNLALALQKLGFKVGVMDTDIYGPSIRKMLPEDQLPMQRGDTIIPALCQGIRMISMAYFRKDNEAVVVRAPIANGLVTQFIRNVSWGDLDYLLIDFPPGTGDIQLTLSQQANLTGAIMVTTPQEVAVMDVRKAMHLFEQVKVPIIGIVENMSYYYHKKTDEMVYLFGKGGGERLARASGVPFLGSIPIDPQLCQCGDSGQSIFSADNPEVHSITSVFMKVAAQLSDSLTTMKTQDGDHLEHFELEWKEMS
jgi:ATP-binding protein involved in chromosome partitioning